ncbi:hypothetical protein [Actinoplanes couchii]|uniref:Uncharacterized protein n=1 Tax=Actinoplanes couchii TaxID=403638 RepID=A0ABQ3XLF0_9ACTN|nr:hypothetical protein [Actinoplanes couchii]MDR6318289.1 hypothetical protein [Actinoplanes couchii]GID59342.1 hypothetical protein Aco03nite_077460 [Actinoplanes couchii]
MASRLRLDVVVGDTVQVRPVVDGRDVLAAFPAGPGIEPETLLTPGGPLTAAGQPREVRLAMAECTEECCGALYVTVRRDGDRVVWGGWRNPDDEEIDLSEFVFDAAGYDRELLRATTDTSWEWPARTVARLLGRHLRETPDILARWNCEPHAAVAWPWQRDRVTVLLFHPGRPTADPDARWEQFLVEFVIGSGDPVDEAARWADHLATTDPRRTGRRVGGN